MITLAIIYVLTVFMAIVASIPQLIKLYRLKCSDEFQLSTWAVWLMAQLVSLAYVISLNNTMLVIANILWVSFYCVMVALIVLYRPKGSFRIRLNRFAAVFIYNDKS